ncbi:MAG: 4'-phosphopantetheinyl transferase superfamily protein [Gammaproteobacteria bacterium]
MRSDALDEVRLALRQILPAGVCSSAGLLSDTASPLHEAERAATARMSPRRLQEFCAGRTQARIVLRELGVAPPFVAVSPARAPLWPTGVVGSISHTGELALAVAARANDVRSIGIDIEPAVPLDAELLHRVCLPAEVARLGDPPRAATRAKLTFSAKESTYKCLAPLTGIFLEFEDVEIRFDWEGLRFTASGHGPKSAVIDEASIAGHFALAGGHWLTAAWIAPPHRSGGDGNQCPGG